jgi:AcrR family transcriptional regulator
VTRRISRDAVLERARFVLTEDDGRTMDALAADIGVSRAALYQLFGSRQALLTEAGFQPAPTLRERIVVAAAEVLAERGLAGLSVDEAAIRAQASRATAYRLFPGKGALFAEVLRTFVPMEEGVAVLEAMPDRPPEEVIPELARSLARTGRLGIGVLRAALFELAEGHGELEEPLGYSVRSYGALAGYLERQMCAGRLRSVHPLLATQMFVGPLVLHLLNRDMAEARLSVTIPVEDAAEVFALGWLRAMAP